MTTNIKDMLWELKWMILDNVSGILKTIWALLIGAVLVWFAIELVNFKMTYPAVGVSSLKMHSSDTLNLVKNDQEYDVSIAATATGAFVLRNGSTLLPSEVQPDGTFKATMPNAPIGNWTVGFADSETISLTLETNRVTPTIYTVWWIKMEILVLVAFCGYLLWFIPVWIADKIAKAIERRVERKLRYS